MLKLYKILSVTGLIALAIADTRGYSPFSSGSSARSFTSGSSSSYRSSGYGSYGGSGGRHK